MIEKIYDIIEGGKESPELHRRYCYFMLGCIVLNLIPLCFRESNIILDALDKVTVTVFIIDYLLRLSTANIKYKQGLMSFIRYPFSLMAIVDLLAILPSLTIMDQVFKTLRIVRATKLSNMIRVTKALRVAKVTRYTQSAGILRKVIMRSKEHLLLLSAVAIGYILTTALIIFNVEPETFHTYFDALYWSTISLTTVGYGDLYSVTVLGRIISMVSSFVGIAIVALPSGIITAGFVKELDDEMDQ